MMEDPISQATSGCDMITVTLSSNNSLHITGENQQVVDFKLERFQCRGVCRCYLPNQRQGHPELRS